MDLLIGKPLADNIKNNILEEVNKLGKKLKLAILLNQEDTSSIGYVKSIVKNAESVNISVSVIEIKGGYLEYKENILALNNDDEVTGILLTRPLPKGVDELELISLIDPCKDVDGIHPYNLGLLSSGVEKIVPNTALAMIELMEYYNIEIKGKKALVVGRSVSVGKPMALLLLNRHATVTIAHSRTENLQEELKNYDIVVAAVGRPHLLIGDNMKEGGIAIDAGIHYLEDGIIGDIKPSEKLKCISKVPGGVGPLTTALLLRNVLMCYKEKHHG